jgi:hypothetical protein
MTDPAFVLDLNPYWSVFEQSYMTSPARLVGPFDKYLLVIVDMFKAMSNDTSEDEVLLDNYCSGSYIKLDEHSEELTRAAVLVGLDLVLTATNVCDQYAGDIKTCVLDIYSRTLLIVYGGENGTP